KIGRYREFIVVGLAMLLVGTSLMVLMDENTSTGKEVAFMLLIGIGIGISIQLLMMVAQKASSPEDLAATTSLYIFMRVLGYSMGVAILQSVMQNSLEPRLDSLAGQYPDYSKTILDSANDQTKIYSPDLPDALRELLVHAFSQSLHKAFIATIPFAAVAFLLVLPLDFKDTMPAAADTSSQVEKLDE
ncbi:hypothetical protein GGI24_002405, partial [Coemansia furcata]